MKKYDLPESLSLLMYAYFRNIHLSINGAYKWKEIQKYYEHQVCPEEILHLILAKADIQLQDIIAIDFKDLNIEFKKSYWSILHVDKSYLHKNELYFYLKYLLLFNDLLLNGIDYINMRDFCSTLSKFNDCYLAPKMSKKSLKLGQNIEHYKQHISTLTYTRMIAIVHSFTNSI